MFVLSFHLATLCDPRGVQGMKTIGTSEGWKVNTHRRLQSDKKKNMNIAKRRRSNDSKILQKKKPVESQSPKVGWKPEICHFGHFGKQAPVAAKDNHNVGSVSTV